MVHANNEKGLESLDVEFSPQFGFDPPWVSNGAKTDNSKCIPAQRAGFKAKIEEEEK
jgi:hypothetical protein